MTTTHRRLSPGDRAIVGLMFFAAGTLAIAATIHLSGSVHGSKPFDPNGAGIAEAVICVVLAAGALALKLGRRRGAALAATAFAIAGFLVGLRFTLSAGDTGDLVYHLTMLPLLIATAVLLSRRSGSAPVTGALSG